MALSKFITLNFSNIFKGVLAGKNLRTYKSDKVYLIDDTNQLLTELHFNCDKIGWYT